MLAARLRATLRCSPRRKRHVEMADEAPWVGLGHFAVAQEIDHPRACVHTTIMSANWSHMFQGLTFQ